MGNTSRYAGFRHPARSTVHVRPRNHSPCTHGGVPYRLGEVVVGDDPFNGRREGLVAVKNGTFVGLLTVDRIFFYDYRQLRRPD